jgi:hypothetical protein
MILLDVTGTGSYAWPQNKAHMPYRACKNRMK